MLSLEDFKKSLGPSAEKLTPSELDRARIMADKFSDMVFDAWLKTRQPGHQPKLRDVIV